ncbi:hypothetical protein [Bacillus cereus]|nr:hypothetical protein [Bacillus cereus]
MELLVQLEEGVSSKREVIACNRLKWKKNYIKHFSIDILVKQLKPKN